MHGRPRKPSKPEDPAASAVKAANLHSLQSKLLHMHHYKIYDKEARDVCAKLLEINPEIYTAWNYRKLAVESNLQSLSDPDAIKGLLDEELLLVERALRRNFKSYGAWDHRKWVLRKGCSSIDREFRLLDQLLIADSRNFNGWNYRRFVAALQNVSEEEELKYTTEKINANFSNYSSWHNRSVLLSQLLKKKAQGFFPKEKVLNEEYELIHQAIFTDPDDQSGWFYHLWLLDQTISQDALRLVSSLPVHGFDSIGREWDKQMVHWDDENFTPIDTIPEVFSPALLSIDKLAINEDSKPTFSKWHVETLENEIALFRELLSEVNCKIANLTLARLLMAYDVVMSSMAPCQKRRHSEEVLELYSDLMKMDQVHSRYYKDQHSSVLMELVTSDQESLSKHLWYHKEVTAPQSHHNTCLRLNKLSLSRIGFLERLLWVQMLDLSHNELQSIEGLEALQLLTCLNLSHNRMKSFTALEPLRSIASLRSLDITYNEIGSHLIDTTRYLFSSPLSHTTRRDAHVEEPAADIMEVGNCWEALLIFRDMQLTQLDITGNAIEREHFKMQVLKVLPSIKWIDGECVN